MEREKKDFISWWVLTVLLWGVTVLIFFGGDMIGRLVGVRVEREVFKHSHQYQEARETAVAVYKAQLAELERRYSGNITEQEKTEIESQMAAIRIQLAAERSKINREQESFEW